jgi:hypothetical protein
MSPGTALNSSLNSLLARVEEVVDFETAALRSRAQVDFAEISRRKSRSLLELTRAARALPLQSDPVTAERLAILRKKLVENRDLLGIHLVAAQEVAALLNDAIREAESDGTYSHARGMSDAR